MKEAKRTQITEQICKQAQLMRKGGANQTEIAMLLGVNPCTISRIEAAGFDLDTYTENRREQRKKEKEKDQTRVELVYDPSILAEYRTEQAAKKAAEEQKEIEGQIEMDLTTVKPSEMSDQVKMMRFLAGQIDKLYMKLNQLNDTMGMVLRAVRGD